MTTLFFFLIAFSFGIVGLIHLSLRLRSILERLAGRLLPSETRPGSGVLTSLAALMALPVLLFVIGFALYQIGLVRAAPGDLTVEILAGYNLVVDSNVIAPSTYGPSAATVAGRVCNTTASPITEVVVYIGDNAAGTPGLYPSRNTGDADFISQHPALADGEGTGSYAFKHEGGSAGLADATRQAGTLAPGQCTVQYWTFSYPRCENLVGGSWDQPDGKGCTYDPVWGDSVKPEDDLWLELDIWTSGNGGAVTATDTWTFTMRNEISAMANKIEPNGNPAGQWFNTDTSNVKPGSVITTNGILYRIGNVRFGFDNDQDYLPDYNFWVQPIGNPGGFDPGCFRLIRTSGIITIEGQSASSFTFTDQLYFTRPEVPSDNTNVIGEIFYTYLAIGSNCAASPSPYQEAASGYDNEKFNGDYGEGGPPPFTNEAAEIIIDKEDNPNLVGVGSVITYTVPFYNGGTEAAGLMFYSGAYVNAPLVISDTIPDGAIYQSGSATYTLSNGNSVEIIYSTDNGQSWTNIEPTPVASITTIQWWLQDPLEPSESGTASFSVLIPSTYSGPGVVENCANAQFDSGPAVAEACEATLVKGPYSLGNEVWRDENRSGAIDAGEAYLDNITLSLYLDNNDDGMVDSGDLLILTTTSGITASGFYTFTDLYSGTYLVTVDTTDPDIPTGYRLSTDKVYSVTLNASNPQYLLADFGFGPSLQIEKTIVPAGACYLNKELNYNITIHNLLGSGGETVGSGCRYTSWATQDNSPSAANKRWLNTQNALGAAGPDNSYASSAWANALDHIRSNTFDFNNTGTISQVEVVVSLYLDQSLTDDTIDFRVITSALGDTDTPLTSNAQSTGLNGYVNNQGLFAWDITGAKGSWDWSDFANWDIQMTAQKVGGGDGVTIYADAVGFRVTTTEPCAVPDPDNTFQTVPLTDTYPTYLDYVSTDPAYSTHDTAARTLTWNIGPMAPGEIKVVKGTFLITGGLNTDITNSAGITGGVFADGGFINSGFVTATCTITNVQSITGVVWSDAVTTGWQGTTGYNTGDFFIPNVQAVLYACLDSSGAMLYPGTPTKACSGSGSNGGTWTAIATTTTSANGQYAFEYLENGYYYVQVTQPATSTETAEADYAGNGAGGASNLNNISGETDPVTTDVQDVHALDGGEIISQVNFGYTIPAMVFGSVWEDIDGEGDRDAADPDLSGITIRLYQNGVLSETTTTDASGNYTFTSVAAGSGYTVTVDTSTLPAGYTWSQTYDPDSPYDCVGGGATCDNSTASFTVVGGGVYGSYDFGFHRSGTYSLGDTVYADWNGDGTQDTGEEGVNGLTVSLYDNTTGALITTTTTTTGPSGATGYYTFTQLYTGTYRVRVDPTPLASMWDNYNQTADPDQPGITCSACDNQATAVLSATQTSLDTVDFGYQPTGYSTIGDLVWKDLSGDDIRNPNGADGIPGNVDDESGIPNITVSLYQDSDNDGVISPSVDALVMTATTDASGNYTFTNLTSGDYLVKVDTADPDLPVDGSGLTYTLSSADPHDVALGFNQDYLDADFGFVPSGIIGDRVWQDILSARQISALRYRSFTW